MQKFTHYETFCLFVFYIHVLQICHIIDIYRVDMFVHQKWVEPRLILHDDIFEEGDDYVTLPPEFFDNLWQPDPYFLNSKIAGKSLSTLQYPTLNSLAICAYRCWYSAEIPNLLICLKSLKVNFY